MTDYDTIRENYDYSLTRAACAFVATDTDVTTYTDEDGNVVTINWCAEDNQEIYTQQIMIGTLTFIATLAVSYSESADIPTHRVENGYEISDHVNIKPTQMTAKLQLVRRREELEQLMAMYVKKELVTVVTGTGSFKNMAIVSINFDEDSSVNTYPCTVQLAEIKYAKVLKGTVTKSSAVRTDAGTNTSTIKNAMGYTSDDGTVVNRQYLAVKSTQKNGSAVGNTVY